MTRKLFGTDGIRGVANVDPMTGELAMQLGRAIAHIFKEVKGKHRIVIGKDTRLSGYMLETALASGICSMGADVMLVGPLPTPGIALITTSMRSNAGVVISASHNPYYDNGIKIFSAEGTKIRDDLEFRLEKAIHQGVAASPAGDDGTIFRCEPKTLNVSALLLLQKHRFLAGLRNAEFNHGLCRNSNSLAGLGVTAHTLFAVDKHKLADTGERVGILRLFVCQGRLLLENGSDRFLLQIKLTCEVGDDRRLGHCLCSGFRH
jgi:hypothetical protein